MIIESPLDIIFRDLFYRLRAFAGGQDVYLKLEGFNISGSIKIKTAIGLIEDLERRGISKPHKTVIVESSSGNSWHSAEPGVRYQGLQVHMRHGFECHTRQYPGHGALWCGGDRHQRSRPRWRNSSRANLRFINGILRSDPNAVWLNQYDNLANKQVHAEQTANEIASEFNTVDWIFVGAGTTGTLAGISEGLRHKFPAIKVVAVEPVGSVTFGGPPGKRNIPGIGTGLRPSSLMSPIPTAS